MKPSYSNNFYVNVTEWVASPGSTKCSKPIEEMSKELNVFHKSFCICKEERWHTVSLQTFTNETHLRAAIDRFLCSLPLNKPFSVISDPAFTEANKALEQLQKIKNGQLCQATSASGARNIHIVFSTLYLTCV